MELMFNNLISSQNVQNLKARTLNNDHVNAKNVEITNYVIMHIFNEVASNKPWINWWDT